MNDLKNNIATVHDPLTREELNAMKYIKEK